MAEFQVHAAADELFLEHGTTPSGAMNLHEHGAWTILGVPRDQRVPATAIDDRIPPLAGLHFENGSGSEVAQVNTAFDLGLDQIRVDLVAQIRVWLEQRRHLEFR